MGQAQDAEGTAQPVERPLAEQAADQVAGVGPELGGAAQTPGRRGHEGDHFRGRQVVGMGEPLAGPAGAGMRGDRRVLVVEHHAGLCSADPERLADEPVGRAVEGALKDDVAVGMELGPFPDRERIGRGG